MRERESPPDCVKLMAPSNTHWLEATLPGKGTEATPHHATSSPSQAKSGPIMAIVGNEYTMAY